MTSIFWYFLHLYSSVVCYHWLIILQANGIARDFLDDDDVYIFDMYNRNIYPQDGFAKSMLDLHSGFLPESELLLFFVVEGNFCIMF